MHCGYFSVGLVWLLEFNTLELDAQSPGNVALNNILSMDACISDWKSSSFYF